MRSRAGIVLRLSRAARLGLAAGCATAFALLTVAAGTGSGGGAEAPAPAGTPISPAPASPEVPSTPDRALGQMIMSRLTGTTASPRLLARIRAGQVGAVILFGENVRSAAQLRALDRSLQSAAASGGNPPLLIAADQEGGSVKRVPFAPPWLAPGAIGGLGRPGPTAEREGRAAGRALLALGVNFDLAPVADVPNPGPSFLGTRAFGRSASTVAEAAGGFAAGLAAAGVAGVFKHFPGLGAAGLHNTDTEVVTISSSRRTLESAWLPYRRAARLGAEVVPFVMVSNAIYTALDPTMPASLSSTVLHRSLSAAGMAGRLVVSDDLEVPAVRRYPDAALRAIRAGVDLLMFAQHEAASEQAYSELREALADGRLDPSVVDSDAKRLVALKARLASIQHP